MALLPMTTFADNNMRHELRNMFKHNRILIVDDEEFCIATMRVMLAKVGIDTQDQVDYCITGNEAVKQVKETHLAGHVYKIIFMDFNMPITDGIEAT